MIFSPLQVGSVKRPSEDSATPETKRTRSMSQVSVLGFHVTTLMVTITLNVIHLMFVCVVHRARPG